MLEKIENILLAVERGALNKDRVNKVMLNALQKAKIPEHKILILRCLKELNLKRIF